MRKSALEFQDLSARGTEMFPSRIALNKTLNQFLFSQRQFENTSTFTVIPS